MSLVNKRVGILFFHDGVGDLIDRGAHVFIVVKGFAKIEFFYIVSHKSGTRCWDCVVEEAFYWDKIHIFSAELDGVVDEGAANSPLDELFIILGGFLQETIWM